MEQYIPEIIILGLFLFLSAFFSGSETALFTLKKSDLHRMSLSKNRSERIITGLMENPQKILITILIGNLFVNLIISALSTRLLLLKWGQYGHFISIGLVTPVIILLGEISPKIIAINSYLTFSKRVARFIYFFHGLFSPLRKVIVAVSNTFIKLLGLKFVTETVTADELGHAVHVGQRQGVLREEESIFIKNIMRFSHKTGENIMTPRTTAFFISYGTAVDEAVELFIEEGAVRAPVYRNHLDNIVGMIDFKDLMPYHLGYKKAKNINRFIRNTYFFPASRDLNDLLTDFLEQRIQVAILVDEFGGTAGVVTLNAILSELMGRGFIKLDAESRSEIKRINDNHYIVPGDCQIHDFNLYFNEELESENSETIAGFIIEQMGHFPKKGEESLIDQYVLRVRNIRKNRIVSLDVINKI
ncbi:MAG TPA: hemolysin family protein [Spirochaetota bacterium]|nr:hemolysin family protein [Spirochaetota bacterium]HPI88822.1 hemolysin family protein [Spirochaetota bacterium]HPR47690.1 hemolysin family protein [Spirochaetota bacterium]